ncbi:sulfite exporter TauE/SafE family protein [Duganella aceris]|uniref:Sulfite exporter TauE/SafE family protein n=1 Tax=Duganella aceris TaxID=2703883 RepID=A0ABX0FFK9_9BURK|nr:sulfite exporter TauE/SafE family protein [Duganella aceris]NGZ83331.1 sulfite exporter TauE/SafE family protein [Duganella aceris]
MKALQLLPVFVVGMAGSIHCVGMCGGIVGALAATAQPNRAARTTAPRAMGQVRTAGKTGAATGARAGKAREAAAPDRATIPIARAATNALSHVLAYNAGRVGSYMLAGALAGGVAGGARDLIALAGVQAVFYWLANLMLIALGLHLMNAWRGLAVLEQGGRVLWQRAQPAMAPMMRSLLPADQAHKAFALGALWGWLPCGMVYSALATAMLSGSTASGAAVMLAFGLGTLPMLTGLGLLGARLQRAMQKRPVRIGCGLLVLAFGMIGLARATGNLTPEWMDTLCLTPHP